MRHARYGSVRDAGVIWQSQHEPFGEELDVDPVDPDEHVNGGAKISVADAERLGDFVERAMEIGPGDGVEDPSFGDDRPQRLEYRDGVEQG